MVRCNWLNIRELTMFHSLILFWKIIKWKCPYAMFEEYEIDENLNVNIKIPRLQMSRNCYLWRVVEQWNALSQELKDVTKISIFKKKLKIWITDRRLGHHVEPD